MGEYFDDKKYFIFQFALLLIAVFVMLPCICLLWPRKRRLRRGMSNSNWVTANHSCFPASAKHTRESFDFVLALALFSQRCRRLAGPRGGLICHACGSIITFKNKISRYTANKTSVSRIVCRGLESEFPRNLLQRLTDLNRALQRGLPTLRLKKLIGNGFDMHSCTPSYLKLAWSKIS